MEQAEYKQDKADDGQSRGNTHAPTYLQVHTKAGIDALMMDASQESIALAYGRQAGRVSQVVPKEVL